MARMEDVLDLYSEAPDPRRPVVCFDETPVQLIGETRIPWPAQPGKPARIDYEYRRNGTANLFVFLDAHRPWRHVKVTERKTAHDFAWCMYELAQVHYRMPRRFASCSIISRRTNLRRCTKSSPPRSLARFCAGWSFISYPSMRAGSTWWRSKSGC